MTSKGAAAVPRGRATDVNAARNSALWAWFQTHGRHLAFRRTRDPYAVLVSEVMLQQTQASRVEPAWQAFMASFPTVETLASASPADVIRAWGNLGYNGRALRLRRAVREIVARYDGAVPHGLPALETLPGIGPYTARAVAAIAFGQPVGAVDTNVGRVVRRLHGGVPGSTGVIQQLADDLVDPARAPDWTHAMMDVGATLCRPREPRCGACPLAPYCRTARDGVRYARRAANKPLSGGRSRTPGRRSTRTAPATPFPATRRWLRGRIVERLRNQTGASWVRFRGPLGTHPPDAVSSALRQLAAEGLIERDRGGRARLPR